MIVTKCFFFDDKPKTRNEIADKITAATELGCGGFVISEIHL